MNSGINLSVAFIINFIPTIYLKVAIDLGIFYKNKWISLSGIVNSTIVPTQNKKVYKTLKYVTYLTKVYADFIVDTSF